ncbi:MAG: hypothetical protein AAF514_06950, partial [Verrucomicrobiota bacterium]
MPDLESPFTFPPSKTRDLIGIGVSTLDSSYVVPEFPDRNTVLQAEASCQSPGGPVATALVAAARLGSQVAMVDRLGTDMAADRIR